jgi:hypothetical protein
MYSLRGLGDANSDYVTALFLKYAGRAPNATEMTVWTTHLANNDFTKPVIEAYFASVFGAPGTSSSAAASAGTSASTMTSASSCFGIPGDTSACLSFMPVQQYTAIGIAAVLAVLMMQRK